VGCSSSSSNSNYLGGFDVVVDFHEIDPSDCPGCESREYLGSTTVRSDGSWSKQFRLEDDCTEDGDSVPDIAVSFRLRFCNDERCFSIEKDDGTLYRLYHPSATIDDPLDATAVTHTLTRMRFETTYGDDYAMAATIFAGLTDITRVWHVDNPVPFDPRGDGELFARYPSSSTSVASTFNDHQIHFPATSCWISGTGVWHEYGHIIHDRAWDGTTGDCGDCSGGQYARDGDSTWGATTREYPNTALQEGWANYVRRVTATGLDGDCSDIDDNTVSLLCNADGSQHPDASGVYVTYPNDGKSYARNVTKLLCDWYDDGGHNDDDASMAGSGDHFTASLWSVWYNLDEMWDWVDDRSGLNICDYIDYYLEGRKSADNVGESTHEDYVSLIADLGYNNGLKCGLDRP